MIDQVQMEDDDAADLPTINRVAVVLLQTEAYLRWAKTCFEGESDAPSGDVRSEPTVYLIPEDDDEPEKYVQRHFMRMLIEELTGWCTDESAWPDLSLQTFRSFFDIHVASMVFDLAAEPLEHDA